jgi:hypothetical protein
VTDAHRPSLKPRPKVPSTWDLNRLTTLLTEQLSEIEKQHPAFFGTLKIELNFREGQIETVAVDRRQTFKD